MIRYSSTVTIARPQRAVYDALLDLHGYPAWTDMVDVVVDEPGEPRVGLRGRFRMAKGPIKGLLEMELTDLETDRRVSFHVTHPGLDWRSVTTLQPAGDATELTYAGEVALRGWKRLLEPLVAGEVRRGEAGEALRLKALLESAPSVGAPTPADP
jgi:uncharacterized protein YndB with AHSA1/START domain